MILKKRLKKRKKKKNQPKNNGFTILELVVALGIVMMLGWHVASYYTWFRQINLRTAAHQLATACRCAQVMARTTNTPHSLTINYSTQTFFIDSESPRSLPLGVRFGRTPITGTTPCANGFRLTWHPHGAGQPTTIHLECGSKHATISVIRNRAGVVRVRFTA